MSEQEMKEVIKEAVTEALKPMESRLTGLERRVESAYRIRNIALITAILCLVAASFSVGYAVNSRTQLHDQLDTNAQSLCSSARQTALAFRAPMEDSRTGRKESRQHYLERLVGQRETLRAAAGLECPSLKGFATFPYLRGKALVEIEGILYRLAPRRFGPPGRQIRTGRGGGPARSRATEGGGAPTGSTGTLLPGPREGGSSGDIGTGKQRGSGGGGSGGGGQGKPPSTSPAPSDPQAVPPASSPPPSPGRSGDAPGDPEPPASPAPGTVPSTVEAAGGAVKEAGEGVGGAVEGVGKGVDCALRGSC